VGERFFQRFLCDKIVLGLNTTKSYISLKKGKVAGMINGKAKFEQDLTALLSRLKIGLPTDAGNKLNNLKDWLLKLQKENVVKINHSVMELVAAKYLILNKRLWEPHS
jgi:transcriptional regulator